MNDIVGRRSTGEDIGFQLAPWGMAITDDCWRVLEANAAFGDLVGLPAGVLVGRMLPELCHEDETGGDTLLARSLLSSPPHEVQSERRYLRADGQWVWVRQSVRAFEGDGGGPRLLVCAIDITATRRAEAALRESEQRFRATFDEAALGIAHISLDGYFLRVNRALCELHGYTEQELVGMHAGKLMADGGQSVHPDARRLLAGLTRSYVAERTFLRRSGQTYPARVCVSLACTRSGETYFVSVIEDLSEAKAAQHLLRRQAHMLEQANDAIVVHGFDGAIRFWNKGAERLLGWTGEEAAGRRFESMAGSLSALKPDELALLMEQGDAVVMTTCETKDGRALRVERRFTLVRDEAGRPEAVLSVNRDMTDHLRAEERLRQFNAQLEHKIWERTQQLESLNEQLQGFAQSLAHDLRGPLHTIEGFAGELDRLAGPSLDDKGRHYLARVRAGVRQMSGLTDAMLALTHTAGTQIVSARVDLSVIAWEFFSERLRGRRGTVDVRIEPDAVVHGSQALLREALHCLLENALKFSGARSVPRIEFLTIPRRDGTTVYCVRDNGVGFDSHYPDRLFKPFSRLHRQDEFDGFGVGLAKVKTILTRHGGQVWAESRPDEGAAFYFTVPGGGPAEVDNAGCPRAR